MAPGLLRDDGEGDAQVTGGALHSVASLRHPTTYIHTIK